MFFLRSQPFAQKSLRRSAGVVATLMHWIYCRQQTPFTLRSREGIGAEGVLRIFRFWLYPCFLFCVWQCKYPEEDKRATTNVQNRFVQFFLLSFLLFCSHWAKTLCFEGESLGGKSAKKCEKLWNDFALLLLPFSFSLKIPRGPNDQKSSISIEIFDLDRSFWSLSSNILISMSRFPHKK